MAVKADFAKQIGDLTLELRRVDWAVPARALLRHRRKDHAGIWFAGADFLVAPARQLLPARRMGAKYVPSVKDHKAALRFQRNQAAKLKPQSGAPVPTAKPPKKAR